MQVLAQRRRLKQQRRDVGLLRQLQVQLQGESAEQAARLARRIARTAEKGLQFPPKLGRQKFQPLPTQVSCSYHPMLQLRGCGRTELRCGGRHGRAVRGADGRALEGTTPLTSACVHQEF